MAAPEKYKGVTNHLPAPFEHIEVNVGPISSINGPTIGHTVGIMNTHRGQGTRGSLAYAEAEARAVLRAIRSYRRRNAKLLADAAAAAEAKTEKAPAADTNADADTGAEQRRSPKGDADE